MKYMELKCPFNQYLPLDTIIYKVLYTESANLHPVTDKLFNNI